MMSLNDRLQRLDELRAERDEIDQELMVLLGMTKSEAEAPPEQKQKRKYERKVVPKPCCGSIGPRHKAACTKNTPFGIAPTAASKTEAMPEDDYESVQFARDDEDFSSLKYSLDMKLPIREVNKAIHARNYKHYLELSAQKD